MLIKLRLEFKGSPDRDLEMTKFYRSFGLKGIAVKTVSDRSSFDNISFVKFSFVYLYKTYYAKPMLLRKHYKEGASVVTHFWVPTNKKINI
jgi:hypothetical protein